MASNGAVRAMAMQSSSSEESYAQNSTIQHQNFHTVAKPMLAEAVAQLVSNIAARTGESAHGRKHIAVADLGCSYGRNTLECAKFILDAVQRNWANSQQAASAGKLPEIQYFFSDLPSNDFNNLFQSLDAYLRHPPTYAAGVPGSFHGRLFPSASLDLVICSYSLHWLSQVPPSILDKSSPAWNGGHVWVIQSSQNVQDAYALQSKIDMVNFLKSRAHEIASGGILFLLHMARKNAYSSHVASPMVVFERAWKESVNEGIITMDEMDTFNMPMYLFDKHELEIMLKDVPEFKIVHMETIENKPRQGKFSLDTWIEVITSATKPTVETHLGEQKCIELYKKLKVIASELDVPPPTLSHDLVVAFLQRA